MSVPTWRSFSVLTNQRSVQSHVISPAESMKQIQIVPIFLIQNLLSIFTKHNCFVAKTWAISLKYTSSNTKKYQYRNFEMKSSGLFLHFFWKYLDWLTVSTESCLDPSQKLRKNRINKQNGSHGVTFFYIYELFMKWMKSNWQPILNSRFFLFHLFCNVEKVCQSMSVINW